MNSNIFEEAKFGNKFLTRDGKVAILIGFNPYVVCISDEQMHEYPYTVDANGSINNGQLNTKFDIVSRYQEQIDEKELNKLSHDFVHSISVEYHLGEHIPNYDEKREIFKKYYRKAKEK